MIAINPLLAKGIAALLLVAALFWLHHHIDKGGYDRAKLECQAANDKATIAASQNLAEANEEVRVKQAALNDTLSKIDAKNLELKNANKKLDSLGRDLRNGTERLSIAVANCSSDSSGQDVDTAVASRTSAKTRAELLSSTLESLGAIADDADEEVRRTNELIDRYNAIFNSIN